MKYVTFETKFGFYGILSDQGGILRTSLPVPDRKTSEKHLLEGLEGGKYSSGLMIGVQKQIKLYFSGTYVEFDDNISLLLDDLSQFSQDILNACLKIPYGQTVSYGELAKMANHPKAARAVGNAMGNNPIPLIIPCHRVLKSDSSIGGFQRSRPGGINLKKRMLALEKNKKSLNPMLIQ